MNKIRIAHLYYDLMNLYGENGNIRALIKKLEEQSVKCEVRFISLEDPIVFEDYDFCYLGSGTEDGLDLTLEALKKYQKELQTYILNGGFFLVSGNAISLFGQTFNDTEGLGILQFRAKQTDFRIIGEQVYESLQSLPKIIGFQNRSHVILDNKENTLFRVLEGTGFAPKVYEEGIQKNHFYGTFLLGPLFIRNPYFTDYLVKEILTTKNWPYKKPKKSIEYQAYEMYIKNFVK